MKKKIVALCLCVALAVVAIGGATLAYFTDTDAKTNTFTVGKIDITLNENFDKENAKLLPGSTTKNAVKKEVSIKLEDGSEDAYVWYEWLIPEVLDDTGDASMNIVHVNSRASTWDKYWDDPEWYEPGENKDATSVDDTWDHDPEEELNLQEGPNGFFSTETIDGIVYNRYVVLYHGKLSAGQTTTVGMQQVYMDSKVDTNNEGKYTINGKVINYDFSKGVNIIVRAYGIQADGFANVYEAYKAYNGIA